LKGKIKTEVTRKKISETLKRKFATGELVSPLITLGIIGKCGKDAPNWQGGKTLKGQKLRGSKIYRDWAKNALKEQNYICAFCKERGGKLQVDHVLPFAERTDKRLDPHNARVLCVDCHRRATFGWKPFEKDFRKAFMDAVCKLAETDKRIHFVTCDVGFSFLEKFKEKYPNRFWNFGVTEMTTTAICAGMALEGLRPIFYSMINFVLYRPFEVIRNALGYHNAPVLLAGVMGSAKYKMLGFSHRSEKNEDINLIWRIPNMKIYIPLKEEEVEGMVRKIFSESNPSYIRL
jgi:hypothetical protein